MGSVFYLQEIDIVNVDGYQGRENDFVFLHLVRCNRAKSIGFAANINRLNVAISRARFGLIIFGSLKMFCDHRNQGWSKFVKELNANAVIVNCK